MSVNSDVDLTLSDAKKPHPCFNVIYKGRREICGIKNQKQKLLLINKVLDLNPTSFLPANIANREDVKAWFDKHNAMAKTRWNSEIVASALCDLDDFLTEASRDEEFSARNTKPKVIVDVLAYFKQAATMIQSFEERPKKSAVAKKARSQKNGEIMQDTYPAKKITADKFLNQPCAGCGHHYLISVGKTSRQCIEINAANRARGLSRRKDYLQCFVKTSTETDERASYA